MFRIIATVLLGMAAGGLTVGFYYHRILAESQTNAILESAEQRVFDAVDALTLVREERLVDFFQRKETEVSDGIYALSFVIREPSALAKTNSVYSIVARYRKKFPHRTGDADVDNRVETFLAMIPQLRHPTTNTLPAPDVAK